MIYHLSLQTAGLICGAVLIIYGALALFFGSNAQQTLAKFPRSRVAGFILLAIDLAWTLSLISTMEMGEFASFRRPLLIALPIGFILALRFLDEFLAVRALGILFLLAAEPLLDAAFFRDEVSRLLVTVFAYVIIVAGLFWVASPYLLRDQVAWSSRKSARWRVLHSGVLVYGVAVMICAFAFY
jgi:hypothetical protein